jgi:mannose-6-phosphate isomerase-like protein (cupin superfamily)
MIDQDEVLERWRARGFEGGLWVDPPGQVWEDYFHGTDELFMVVEGRVELEIQGRASRPAIGEEVLIPARARHSVRNVGPGTARWLYSYKRR